MNNRYPEHYEHIQTLVGKLGHEIPGTMGGGPSLMYGCEALEALEQFEAEGFEQLVPA